MKYSPSIWAGWQKRYFVLKDRKLKYFKSNSSEHMKVPLGVINFDHFRCWCEPMVEDKNLQFSIGITGVDKRQFIFKAATESESMAWQKELRRHIDNSAGFQQNKSAKGIDKPWRFDNVSEKQFLEKADTGDLLLFKASNSSAGVIRTFTGSQFDHVAMILKFETDEDEIYYVEASGNMGVALNKWSSIRKHVGHKKFYERVIFRHIEFDRNDTMVENLECFLKEAIGQRYGLNVSKMMRRQT